MKEKVVTLRLVDGSVHETVLDTTEIANPKEYIENLIMSNSLIRVKHPRYKELFGEEYIVGENVISFRISDNLEK